LYPAGVAASTAKANATAVDPEENAPATVPTLTAVAVNVPLLAEKATFVETCAYKDKTAPGRTVAV
jgi:hypothetical protein